MGSNESVRGLRRQQKQAKQIAISLSLFSLAFLVATAIIWVLDTYVW